MARKTADPNEQINDETETESCVVDVVDNDSQKIIFLWGDVSKESCGLVVKEIIKANLSGAKAVHLVISSQGGDLPSAMGVVDVIRGSNIPVVTYGLGEILSSGLVIFMAGHYRVLTKNTDILSHQFSMGAQFTKYHDFHALDRGNKITQDRMIRHYQDCTKQSKRLITKNFLGPTDCWMTPQEALKYKFADFITERFELIELDLNKEDTIE